MALDLRVLVVDDDKNILKTLTASLESLGCAVTKATSGEEGLKALGAGAFDLVLTDVRMSGVSGVELVERARPAAPATLFVVMTAFASFDNAVQAIKVGAYDYLPKPFSVAQLEHVLAKVRTVIGLQRENARLRGAGFHADFFGGCTSAAMRRLQELTLKVAPTDATVLLVGESGTGKSELARLIHARSARASGPFVEVNCANLAESLLDSELFGHVKGAFTGAAQDRAGKLELASGGTVFLDEIGELSAAGQAKLLRFLQERVVERVGGGAAIAVDARVLAATNRKLDEGVASGAFREDLYYRLNVFECFLPPLRQRPEDVPVLIGKVLAELAAKAGVEPLRLPEDVEARLRRHAWPGNVREVRNVLERLTILCRGRAPALEDLPQSVLSPPPSKDKDATPIERGPLRSLEEVELEHIKRVLAVEKNQERAAKILGITTVTLWRKRKEYQLD